jgi:signal transduction histidine kinase
MYALAIGSQLVVPYSYLAIFVVIWSAILPYYVPWKHCLVLSVPIAIPTALIQANLWHEQQAVLTGALFWTFNLFAMIMSNTAIKEARAREDADALNRQLSSTQQLMKQALTQDERLRIARNIHDVLGHHLTALTINLQVASRKVSMLEGKDPQDIKKHVEQSHSIAKLLLSDVREAVSDIRENAAINFSDAVHALVEELPRPRVALHIDDNLSLTNVSIADCLLRCMQEALTNVIKHSSAQFFVISLQQQDGSYYLCMQDSCVPSDPKAYLSNLELNLEEAKHIHDAAVTPGNGLKGMQERVSSLGGHIAWQQNKDGFQIDIQIPEVE